MRNLKIFTFLLLFSVLSGTGDAMEVFDTFKNMTKFLGSAANKVKEELTKPKDIVIEGSTNLQRIWNEYYGKVPGHYNCSAFVTGSQTAIETYVEKGRIKIEKTPAPWMACSTIRNRIMRANPKPLEKPFAVARNVHNISLNNDYYIQELLLAIGYSPSNIYCFALDEKLNEEFKTNMEKLADCVENVVILEQQYAFSSSGHFQNHAHTDCSRELLNSGGNWTYVLLIQSHDVILKTPEEISEIIGVLNGSSWSAFDKVKTDGKLLVKYSPQELNLFKNESHFDENQQYQKLKLKRGPVQMFLSREFVQAVEDHLNLTTALDTFNSVEFGADVNLYPTLLGAHHLNLPGQFESTYCLGDSLRYVKWSKKSDGSDCKSQKRSDYLCLLGMEYLSELTTVPQLIASEILPEWDFGSIMCLAETLKDKQDIQAEYDLDLVPYQSLPQVREHQLKTKGKFDKCEFRCDSGSRSGLSEIWTSSTSNLCGVLSTLLGD